MLVFTCSIPGEVRVRNQQGQPVHWENYPPELPYSISDRHLRETPGEYLMSTRSLPGLPWTEQPEPSKRVCDVTMLSETSILRKIERQPKQSAGFKQLARELGVRGDQRRQLAARLDELVRRGELVEDAHDRYCLPRAAAGQNIVRGRLSMHRDGYGFVTPEDGPGKDRVAGSVFINPQAVGDAMHGDRVQVELTAVREDGRAEGRILKVVGRAHPTVVGTFHYGPRHNYVVPIDEKITRDVLIPRGLEVPPESTAHPSREPSRHRVLGAEATRRRPVDWDNLEGVVVDVEITEWPTPTQNPRGRVIEVLGYEDDFGVDVEIIIRKYHLPHRFPLKSWRKPSKSPTRFQLAKRLAGVTFAIFRW